MEVVSPVGRPNELSSAKRRLLEQRMRGRAEPSADAIPRRREGSRTPASAEQYRIWLHASMQPEMPIYHESVTLHRYGRLDLTVLEASFNAVLARHEAWRTYFRMERGELLQVIVPNLRVALSVSDLTSLPECERLSEACRLASEDARLPFDLEQAPLFRAGVYRLANDHHWLQLTLHHILFDGVSLHRVFLPELASTYEAMEHGLEARLPVPALQYADYSAWHAGRLLRPEIERHLAYWREELAGDLPVLRLPADRPRPPVVSHRGSIECFEFPERLTAAMHALARTHGATLYMVLLASLKALFFRYSGQEDVIVGGLADGRRRLELEGLMGCFLQTFALRTRPRADLSFVDYLLQVKRSVLGALAAAEVPFDQVVQAVQLRLDQSHHPLFQTFLAFQPGPEECPDGWAVSKTDIAVETSKFDLYLEVEERAGCLRVRLMYSTDLFDATTIQRMAAHWRTLLQGATMMPECALGDLPLLTRDEEELMLGRWNETSELLPDMAVHEAIEEQTRRTPHATAVEFEGRAWTYRELDRRVGKMAQMLRSAGLRAGDLAAVSLERSLDLVCVLLAILKVGAAYLPLDPDTPLERRRMCLEDSQPKLLVTQQASESGLHNGLKTLLLNEDGEEYGPEEDAWEPERVDLQSIAYVIHTSGSTGRPKGVEITHCALMNLLLSMREEPGFKAEDTLLAVTTISFDIAGLELFLPLITGGRVVIASRQTALDPYLLAAAIESSDCTVMQATPATWRSLLAVDWPGRTGLRVLCGGEALPRDLAEQMLLRVGEVWNVYGPTETTIWSTVERVTHGIGPVAAGRPIRNTTAYILDRQKQPVPVGVQGELYLGGAGLARGYRGQPELTAEKFVRLAVSGGARLYRTGDFALYRPDGRIEIQGRADNQVKVRGYRIELEDVEAALCADPRVAAAAAKVWPDGSGGNRLSAYVVSKPGTGLDAAGVRTFLRGRLPEYMVPSDVSVLQAMPLTQNGKLDRRMLQQPIAQGRDEGRVRPSTDQERRLTAIWSELLGVEKVGVTDNFFELGGHSLLVARLQMVIKVEFGRKLTMAAIFHAPTIVGQLALVNCVDDRFNASRLLPIQPSGSRRPVFWLEPSPQIGNLAASLGDEQPLLGVTITGDDLASLGPNPDFSHLAACYVKTITQTQVKGPYLLGGLCTGGILAYEVACQLRDAGHGVSRLIMLDAENPVFYRRMDTVAVELSKLKFYSRRALAQRGAEMFLRHVRSRVKRLFGVWSKVATEMSAVERAVLQAALRYQPPIFFGDVLLLLPSERPSAVDYRSGWKDVIRGSLACVEVKSHHDELLSVENADEVAQAMMQAIDAGAPLYQQDEALAVQ